MKAENIWRHFRTVTRHRHMVILHCCKAGLYWQGLGHDLSKYSPAEFIPGVQYYQGTRSPNEQERQVVGYSLAWMHHKGRNKHHFEYWTDYNTETHTLDPVKMPLRYVIEMFCDRVAASKIYNGADYTEELPLAYFLRAKPRRRIHPETAAFLEKLLRMLSVKGEEWTFAWIRHYLATHETY